MQVNYKGEQTLSINGTLITKGLNDVPQPIVDQLQKMAGQDAYKDKFEFKGGDPKDQTDGFGLNKEIRTGNEKQGLAPDSDIPGDSEMSMVGGAGDQALAQSQEQDVVERNAEGSIEAPTSTSRKKRS